MGRTPCTEPQCLYSRAVPLLPVWAVRPVQSLSACTVELYLYSPYGAYGLYRASVPVQGCTVLIFRYLQNFKYLGVTLSDNNNHQIDLQERIINAYKKCFMLQNFFRNKNISKKLKLRLKNTTVDETLTYASETWVLKEIESK